MRKATCLMFSWPRSLSCMGVSRAAGHDCFSMFSSWPSHGNDDDFIFTHLSVLGVFQLSSSVLAVRGELLFKVLCGWSLFRHCGNPAAPPGS